MTTSEGHPFASSLKIATSEVGAFTTQASAVARTSALAGVGIVWLYADRDGSEDKLSVAISSLTSQWWMLAALALFLICLALDVVQYLYASWRWQQFEEAAGAISTYDDFVYGFPDDTLKHAWSSRAGIDLASHITKGAELFLTAPSYQQKPSNQIENVIRARFILGSLYVPKGQAIQEISETGKEASVAELLALKEYLDLSWAPERIATKTNRVFWSKMLCVAAGYICILATIGIAIYHHIGAK